MARMQAEAGPSSAPESHWNVKSFRQLYDALEAADSTTPKKAIQRKLNDVLPTFRDIARPPAKSSASSRAKVESNNVLDLDGSKIELDVSLKNLCFQFSDQFRCCEEDTARTLRHILDTEDIGLEGLTLSKRENNFSTNIKQKSLHAKRARVRGDVTSSFIDVFSVFFFEERLYILRCISALLRIGDDQFHELHDLAVHILDSFADQDFGMKCLDRAKVLSEEELEETVREVPRYSSFLATCALREQFILLEIVFLLFYSRLESSARFVKTLMNTIKQTDFGKIQSNSGFFNNEATQIVETLSGVYLLLAIESMDCESMVDGLDLISSPRNGKGGPVLLDEPNVVIEAVDYLRASTARDSIRAPLMIVWALFLNRIDETIADWGKARPTEALPSHLQSMQSSMQSREGVTTLWTDFVSVALSSEMDLFSTIKSLAGSPLLTPQSSNRSVMALSASSCLAFRAVLKGFLLSITELVRPEYIEDYIGLLESWEQTYSNSLFLEGRGNQSTDSGAALSVQFWQVDYQHEQRRAVLDTATRRFPVSFRPLLRLCKALSGSSPGALHLSDDAFRSSTAVFHYLAQVTCLTQVIPPYPAMSLPYEAVTLSDASIGYRATRDIPVFGRYLVVPSGTFGRMLSQADQTPAIMIWDISENPMNVWRLLGDVLANFAGTLERREAYSVTKTGDASVFAENDPIPSFVQLAPDEPQGKEIDAAADIMDLISSLLGTQPSLSRALLNEIEGKEVQFSLSQPFVSKTSFPTISIVLGILSEALAAPAATSKLIISAYRLLTLLVTSKPQNIWLPMRTSNALIGAYGSSSVTATTDQDFSSSNRTSLLTHEVSIGKYAGLISLLDFHHGLLNDLQQNLLVVSEEETYVKADVMIRALQFVAERVWTKYQDWKYVHIQHRIEIGLKCMQIFASILSDETLRRHGEQTAKIVEQVEFYLCGRFSSPYMLNPLLHVLAKGQRFLNSLLRAQRLTEVNLCREEIEAALSLAETCIISHSHLKAVSKLDEGQATLGRLESAFFEHPSQQSQGRTSKTHPAELAGIVFGYTSIQHAQSIRIKAIDLLTRLCASVAEGSRGPAPTLISHLGSLSEVEGIISTLIAIVSTKEEPSNIRSRVWNMFACLANSQPGIATLLLTGKHVASGLSSSEFDEANKLEIQKTALQTANQQILDLQNQGDFLNDSQSLQVLENILKFLSVAWDHALEHVKEFIPIRESDKLWETLFTIACSTDVNVDTLPKEIWIDGNTVESSQDHTVRLASLKMMCSARAVHVITTDIRLAPMIKKRLEKVRNDPSNATTGRGSKSMDVVFSFLADSDKITGITSAVLQLLWDPLRHDEVPMRLAHVFPELQLDDFRVRSRSDDFDLHKDYGSQYVYNLDSLRRRLDGILHGEGGNALETLENEDALKQVLSLVAGLNLDWCIIDTQSFQLRAWAALWSIVIGPLFDTLDKDKTLRNKVSKAISSAWTKCTQMIADEAIESDIVHQVHALRVALLAVMIECAWSLETSSPVHQLSSEHLTYSSQAASIDAIEVAIRLITHPIYSVEEALRHTSSNQGSFCRDTFRILLVCAHRYNFMRHTLHGTKEGDAIQIQRLTRCAEVMTTHAITYTQLVLSKCTGALGNSSREAFLDASYDMDLQLLTAVLSILLRNDSGVAVHIWSPKMQTSTLLETALDVFGRCPLPFVGKDHDIQRNGLFLGVKPLYWDTLLNFFLDLSSQETTGESLILAGIVNSLSVNTMSALVDSGQSTELTSRLPQRLPNTNLENPMHSCWIQMLQIVASLVSKLNLTQQYIFVKAEVTTFFRIYQVILDECLDRPLLDAGMLLTRSGFGRSTEKKWNGNDTISLKQLQEIDYTLNIYTHILRSNIHQITTFGDKGSTNLLKKYTNTLVATFVKRATMRLQEAVHLLQHPRELQTLLGGTNESRTNAADMQRDNESARRHLLQACSSIVEGFWLLGNGQHILCSSDPADWDLARIIVTPNMATTFTRPSSIGTLLELAAHVIETMKVLSRENEDLKSALVALLEQTVSLATAQLALALCGKQISNESLLSNVITAATLTEVESGLGRDVRQSIELARSAVQQNNSKVYFDILLSVHDRWLGDSDA